MNPYQFLHNKIINNKMHHLANMFVRQYPDVFENIKNTFNFLDNPSKSQLIFHYYHNLKYSPKCTCGKELRFKNINVGYSKFCGPSCSKADKDVQKKFEETMMSKYGYNHNMKTKESKNRRKSTWLKKYGVDSPSKLENIKNLQLVNRRKSLEESGKWLKSSQKDLWINYCNEVMAFTRKSLKEYGNIKFGPNWEELRGPNDIHSDNYQIDHIISKKYGFLHNIHPEYIGHIENLSLIHWKDNNKKSINCSLTLDELMMKINS